MVNLKFRVWDEDNKGMEYIDLSDLDKTIETLDGYRDYFSSSYFANNPEYVMAFTGYKDRNDKDIYIRDRVKILYTDWISKSFNDPRTIQEYMWDLSKEGIVVWERGEFCVKFNEESYGSIHPGQHGFIETIGNNLTD